MQTFARFLEEVGNLDARTIMKLLVFAVCVLTAFILLHAVFDCGAYLLYRFRFRTTFVPRSWLVLLLATLWGVLSPSRSFALSADSSENVIQSEIRSQPKEILSINSLLTCSVVMASLLVELGKLRGRQLCKLEMSARLNHPSAMAVLTEMSLRGVANSTAQSSEELEQSVQPLQASQGSTLFLPANSEQPVFIPLGKSDAQLVYIDLGKNTILNIVSDPDAKCQSDGNSSKDACRAVFNALLISTLFTASEKLRVFYYSSQSKELIPFSGIQVVNSLDDIFHVSKSSKTQAIVFCRQDLSEFEFNQLIEHDVSVVCLQHTQVRTMSIEIENGQVLIQPNKIAISPFGLSSSEITSLDALFADVVRCGSEPVAEVPTKLGHVNDWKILVRTLGPVEVQLADGTVIKFEKSKTTELLAWLTHHRSRPTRSAARTALWEFNVADATFTNVVSDVRRTLNQTHLLDPFDEWIPRTFNDQLSFHSSIVSDGELLQACMSRAKTMSPDQAVAELHRGLELVRDLPFAGTGYLWPDSEGITSQLVMTVISAACMAAEIDLMRGDYQGVFWATAQGLKVLGAHEELFALRMRAHNLKGDLAGVRFEYQSYKRALHLDSVQAEEPSKKLAELYNKLTHRNSVALVR